MCCNILRDEFRLIQFRLLYPNAEDFSQSPWFGLPVVLLYRFIIAAFCSGCMIVTVLFDKWYIKLTNWSFLFVTLYFVCAAIVTAIHYKRKRKQRARGNNVTDQKKNDEGNLVTDEKSADTADSNRNLTNRCETSFNLGTRHVCEDGEVIFASDPPESSPAVPMAWFHEALWVIYNIASVAAMLVTLAFWLLIFNGNNKIIGVAIISHGVNSIVMIGDTMLSSVPVRLFHVIYPMLYCIAYIVFTVIYWAASGGFIYPQTDYTGQPVLSAVSQLCLFFIGIPLCQTIMFGFYKLRVCMKTKCGK
ncbi:hypothetical protein ACROYT_G005070 [Oculina patagonica]